MQKWGYYTTHHKNILPHAIWDNELSNVFILFHMYKFIYLMILNTESDQDWHNQYEIKVQWV
jgi:hypothetical protein